MASHLEIRHQLEEALRLKILLPGLQSCALSDYTNTANKILMIVRDAQFAGLSTSQVAHRSRLHSNTVKIYLRELRRLKLIDCDKKGQQEAIWFLKN